MNIDRECRLTLSQIQSVAAELGLCIFSVISARRAEEELDRNRKHLERWQLNHYSGEMGYMNRPAELLTGLDSKLPDTASVVCFRVQYASPATYPNRETPRGYGRVARYAWGEDYHNVLKEKLNQFILRCRDRFLSGQRLSYRVFSDAVPLLERSLHTAAGLGFIGRNSMLIQPGEGSFSFLAEVLWSVHVEESPERAELISVPGEGCGTCKRCQSECPTGAIVSDGVINASRCISYLTIEKRGELDSFEQSAIGDWVFGCDICQDCCPFNHQGVTESVIQEFDPKTGAGEFLSLVDLLSIREDKDFIARFSHTALMRAGREQLLRNAIAVVANSMFVEANSMLQRVATEDSSKMLREMATTTSALFSA